ncbi:hypothetical protein AB0H71_26170 [Nocardia sp. NPDC050697]|uniref:hypothetical protein n=1 Tax=Nocardia sp. NPDC050697 TaxID=3155158 RepID=UPI0033F0B0BD
MSSTRPRFVQLPHPGREIAPRQDAVPWNTGSHGRKFLRGAGEFLAESGEARPQRGELAFWGEWESPSRIVQRWPRAGQLPRALHEPCWTRPIQPYPRQNTDPWVFGERMIYSNCKQNTRKGPTALRSLDPGSVIVFGSALGGEFCVDTVFVVASAEPWTPLAVGKHGLDDAFLAATAEPLGAPVAGTGGGCAPSPRAVLTLYRAATFDEPVNGMYSFVPALPADADEPRFARPSLRIPGAINPASAQSHRCAPGVDSPAAVYELWSETRQQVVDQDLVLATHLDIPARCVAPTADVPPRRGTVC